MGVVFVDMAVVSEDGVGIEVKTCSMMINLKVLKKSIYSDSQLQIVQGAS